MVVLRIAPALLVPALVAASLAAQVAQFEDAIEVRVVNVDAVVTGPNGVPVRGLGAEEFELLVDGRSMPISYFAAMEDGRVRHRDAPSTEPGTTNRPYLAVLWDQRAFRPKDARVALGALIERLPALLEATQGILVARLGSTLGVEQSFTSNPGLLLDAIDRLDERKAISFSRGERTLLLSRLARAPGPDDANTADEARLMQEQADRLLREINLQAQQERQDALGALGQLRQLVNLISSLPGRKSVLYVGGGLETRPGEALHRIWWDKYGSIAARLRVPSFASQSDLTDLTSGFVALTEAANSQRVAFYTQDSSGGRPSPASVEYASAAATEFSARESIDQQHNLIGLATATGGLGTLSVGDLEPLLEDLLRDLGSYYSLGFEASDATPRGAIEVRVRRSGLRVRHSDRFDLDAGSGELERATMTALLTDQAPNPLELSVEVGDSEKQGNGTYVVPLLVKVPIAQLTLLPRADRHVGKLSLVVLARSAEGDLSPPAYGDVPIEIDNSELLAALSRLAGYRLRMQVSPGEQTIAIGLRDEIGRTLSTLHLVLDAGQGP